MKNNGGLNKERIQTREREQNGVVTEQQREQRTNGTDTQSRSRTRSKDVNDSSAAPSSQPTP